MTIANNYAPVVVAGNGTTTVFTGSWNALTAAYLQVALQNQTTGVSTPVSQGPGSSQYQVTTLTATGFSITFGTAPASGYNVIISRSTTPQQTVPYSTSRGFQGGVEEDSFDTLTAMIQENNQVFSRSISVPLGDTATNLQLPIASLRANYVLAFDGSGNVIVSTVTLANIEAGSTNAAASAAAAAASASAASASQTAAAGSATSAAGSATAAAASAASLPNAASTGAGNVPQSNGTSWTGIAVAPLNSPAFTGTPTAPTQSGSDNSTKIATTAMVQAALSASSGAVKTVKVQEFTSSGTYTPSTGMLYCIVEVQAPGGSGGGSGGGGSGSGGGAGGYSKGLYSAATIGSSQSVTVNAGGAGVTGTNNGNNGAGVSSFGSLISCNPGNGGLQDSGTRQGGGVGGTVGTAGNIIAMQGESGDGSITVANGVNGGGGSCPLGYGGKPPSASGSGQTGTGYGSGGSGLTNGSGTSGAGAHGVVIVTEFCSQ